MSRLQPRPTPNHLAISPPSTPSPAPETTAGKDYRCRCPASSPPTINHSLFHCTTRTPLHVHPALWSLTHLDLLCVSVALTNPPADTDHRHSIGPPSDIVSHFVSAHEFGSAPPFPEALSLLTASFESLPGAFAIDYSPLPLQLASTTTTLTPHGIVTRTQLPFAAITSPSRRNIDRACHRHRHRCLLPPVQPPVYPADIALLIALAQRQQTVLPRRVSFTVHVLAPDETARFVRGMTAEVHGGYLLALKEPWRPMERLEVQLWQVAIGDNAEGISGLVGALGEGAVRLKPKKGRSRGKN